MDPADQDGDSGPGGVIGSQSGEGGPSGPRGLLLRKPLLQPLLQVQQERGQAARGVISGSSSRSVGGLWSANRRSSVQPGRDSDTKLLLYGRALRSEVKLDPLEMLGTKYKVNNMFDEVHPARDFHNVVKQSIDDMMGREVTFDILFHNSEHQATLFRYGVKKSEQIDKIYEHIMPAWKKLFEEKKL